MRDYKMKTKYFYRPQHNSKSKIFSCYLLLTPGSCILMILVASFFLLNIPDSYSIPSFSRQTNMACNACHTVFPRLTTFGRIFKLNGYNITGNSTIESKDKEGKTMLKILTISPISVMFQTSYTHLNTKQPGTQNDNIEFPQQLSLLYGGGVAPHLGMFIQMTYAAQDGTIGLDNTDLRYANTATLFGKSLVYGFTMNNNPTVQDVWNSTPAWGFPFAAPDVVPTPSEATMVEGGLEQAVAGVGAYALFNNLVYGEFSIYRSAQLGAPAPPDSTSEGIIKGVSPYWRLAFQKNWNKHYLEIGTFGLSTQLYPLGVTGLRNNFLDFGVDLQYEYNMDIGNIVLHSSFVNEKQTLNASFDAGDAANETVSLNSFKADGTIYFKKGIAATIGYFAVSGDKDDVLYTPGSISGNSTGEPNSNGFIAQVDFLPWYNTNFSLQYTYYNKFNGAKKDYDGFGRNATDNNVIYLVVWVNF
jgi:hypothetical protein